jgi:spiro-SPASM protein
MQVNAIINAVSSTKHAAMPLVKGKNSRDILIERIHSLSGLKKVLVLTDDPDYQSNEAVTIFRNEWSVTDILTEAMKDQDADTLFFVRDDQPFLDTNLAEHMLKNHRQYAADFSYADGYPEGLTGEIITTSIIPSLVELAGKSESEIIFPFWNTQAIRKAIFNIIKEDINAFDIETAIAEDDVRLLRIKLFCDSHRNYLLCKAFAEEGALEAPDITKAVYSLIHTKPELLRTKPAFFPIQIAGGCPQACTYCPYPQKGGDIINRKDFMESSAFFDLTKRIALFSPESVVGISLWGDPVCHPQLVQLIKNVCLNEHLALLIETSGVAFPKEVLNQLPQVPNGKLNWIISLDAITGESYSLIRGKGFDSAIETVNLLSSRYGKNVHVQAVRMNENEDELEEFYQRWNKNTQAIIQKYDHFCGFLPDKRIVDLSPINRFPCWHLKRDFPILIDGDVPACREDLNKEMLLGNVFKDQLDHIWENGKAIYLKHVTKVYPKLCRTCDEYYTFNF